MNIERFYDVIITVKEELDEFKIPNLIQGLESSLSNSLSQPNPQTAQAFADTLFKFNETLAKCPSNDFQPSRYRILESIDGNYKTGSGLRERIDTLLGEEKITPANALSKIQKLRQEVSEFHQIISQVYQAFDKLNIKWDALKENEAEVGLLIPTELVDGNMTGLVKELQLIEKKLLIFAEVAGAPAESFKVRSVGSGSFDIFLSSTPAVAACIMAAIERLAALYKRILEIRLLRLQLEERDIPKETTKQLKKNEEEIVKRGLEQISEEIVKEYYKGKDAGRKNELRNALEIALKFIGDRIDRGLDIEADAYVEEEQKEDEQKGEEPAEGTEQKEHPPVDDNMLTIQRSGSVLRALKRSTEPVLQLTEGERKKVEKADEKESK